MSKLKIQVVDESDRPVREASVEEVWKTGERHRIAWVIVLDKNRNMLLQKRSHSKKLWPDRWDVSAGGHIDAGETHAQAAARELQEELGIENVKLLEVDSFYDESVFEGKKLNRFYKTYQLITQQKKFEFQKSEISGVRWFSPDELKKLKNTGPDQITGGLKRAIEKIYGH